MRAATRLLTAPRTASDTTMPPGRRDRLQSSGDVDAVAIHIAIGLLDHIAEVHADAKAQAAFLGHIACEASSSRWMASAAVTAPAAVSNIASTESPTVLMT